MQLYGAGPAGSALSVTGTAVCSFVALVVLWGIFGGIRIIDQTERGVVLRFGRARRRVRQPGIAFILPLIDRLRKVNVQIAVLPVPSQEGITRDNVSVKVDAVVYFRVADSYRALIEVQNYVYAVELLAQTSLRSTIGKAELDDLLANRDELHRTLVQQLAAPAEAWGVQIDRVEIKDVQLPESMKRSMSKQAEAERERRARVITADGEFRAAQSLADASTIMADTPGAMQLRLLQTVVEVAAEKNSTLVMPFPIELLRYFDTLASGSGSPTASAPHPQPSAPRSPDPVPPAGPPYDQWRGAE